MMRVPTSDQLPDEPSVYPYQAAARLPGRSMLVVAPHPDDEVFGCGGALALAMRAGIAVQVVIVSDGGAGGDALVREREVAAAARVWAHPAAPPPLHFWRLPDRQLQADAALVDRLAAAVQAAGADLVLVPSPWEVHPDHRVVSIAATQAFAAVHTGAIEARLAYYEVGHPLLPNLLLDITPVLPRKAQAMACFVSQLAVQRYDEHMLALNRYRSYTLGPAVTHAEAFHVIGAEVASRGVAALIDGLALGVVQRLGIAPRL